MFPKSRVVSSAFLAFVVVTVAIASVSGECTTGSIQCCNSVTSPADLKTAALLKWLGVEPSGIVGSIGVTCNPNNVNNPDTIPTTCSDNVLCCSDDSYNGIVAIGCNHTNLPF